MPGSSGFLRLLQTRSWQEKKWPLPCCRLQSLKLQVDLSASPSSTCLSANTLLTTFHEGNRPSFLSSQVPSYLNAVNPLSPPEPRRCLRVSYLTYTCHSISRSLFTMPELSTREKEIAAAVWRCFPANDFPKARRRRCVPTPCPPSTSPMLATSLDHALRYPSL